MKEKLHYDSHCHIFTQKETLNLRLLFEVIFGLPIEHEKHQKKHKTLVAKENIIERIQDKIAQLKRVKNFLETGCSGSEETIYKIMETGYGNSYGIVPLMFDLECVFVSKRMDGTSDFHKHKDTIVQEYNRIVTEFQDSNHSFIKEALAVISEIKLVDKLKNDHNDLTELQELHKELNTHLSLFSENKMSGKNIDFLLSNFDLQKKNIKKLKKKYPKDIFPFIAVDPRRKEITTNFKKEINAKKGFCGVKLYTPNGYSPTDPDLMRKGGVYDYCQENNIPITAHHSYSGFATPLSSVEVEGYIYEDGLKDVVGSVSLTKAFSKNWVQDRATKFNHPEIWEQVLFKYPNLKLNLAHFGKGNANWQTKIYELISNPNYPNFYTDLSCWCDFEDINGNIGLKTFYKKYFERASDYVRSKILYGSDFYLDLIYVDSLDAYLSNFKMVFSKEEFKLISKTNAEKFLFNIV